MRVSYIIVDRRNNNIIVGLKYNVARFILYVITIYLIISVDGILLLFVHYICDLRDNNYYFDIILLLHIP